MTKEEFQRDLIRMFDSLRNKCKGEKNCRGINCRDCPFGIKVCNADIEMFHAHEAIEIVENWAKEHPIVTNADKFREVFGFDMTICWDNEFPCNECQFCDIDGTCNSKEKFWNAEYKEPAESEDKE